MSMFAGCSWPTIVVENLKSEEITELSLILSLSNEKEIIMMMVMMIMNDGEFIKLCCHCYISNIGHVKTKGTSKTQGFCLGPLQPLPTIHSNRVIFISMTEGKIVILFLWQVCLSWGVASAKLVLSQTSFPYFVDFRVYIIFSLWCTSIIFSNYFI